MTGMPETGQPAPRGRAFTLLEVMLAVTIMALVVTAVYTTFNSGLTAWRHGAEITDTFQRQRVVLDTLTELAQSVVFVHTSARIYQVQGASNLMGGDSVSFVTASDALLPPGEATIAGMRRVTISLERDMAGQTYLAIANEPAMAAPEHQSRAEKRLLSADVDAFHVRYRNPQNGVWTDRWEDAEMMPGAMEFTVSFIDRSGRLPPLIVTRAVELPGAVYAFLNKGRRPDEGPGQRPAGQERSGGGGAGREGRDDGGDDQ
jgi:prepilin-type N-terminal cleavage/methylation domain-containing protein